MNQLRDIKPVITKCLKNTKKRCLFSVFNTFIGIKRVLINTIKKLLWINIKTCSGINTLLVIKIGGLGDFVMGIPALNLLIKNMQNEKIIFITSKSLILLGFKYLGRDHRSLDDLPWVNLVSNSVDEVLSVSDLSVKSIKELAALLATSKRKAIFILGYPGMPLSSVLKKFVFARLLTNYSDACFGTDKVLDDRFMRNFQKDQKLSKHKMLGDIESVMEGFPGSIYSEKDLDFRVSISTSAILSSYEKIGSKRLQSIILLAPVATTDHKQWPLQNYVQLVKDLIRKDKTYHFVIIGTLDHFDVVNQLFQNFEFYIQNLCGKLSIQELAALLSDAKGYIGNDGGMSQLASLVGCPSVIVFNSVEEDSVTYPWRSLSGVVRNYTDCSPCYNPLYCPKSHRKCVTDIAIEAVHRRVIEIIFNSSKQTL
jgi:ADP-heptose:LPS heptosyltransferase